MRNRRIFVRISFLKSAIESIRIEKKKFLLLMKIQKEN